MKTPTWAYIIGILMMLFGGCSLLSDASNSRLDEHARSEIAREVNKELKKNREKRQDDQGDEVVIAEEDSLAQNQEVDAPDHPTEAEEENTEETTSVQDGSVEVIIEDGDMPEFLRNMMNFSEYSLIWTQRFGYVGIAVAITYILGGLFLMVVKKFSIKLAYVALALSILFTISRAIVLGMDPDGAGIIAMGTGFKAVFGIVIDVIFLLVVIFSDKDVYDPQPVFDDDDDWR